MSNSNYNTNSEFVQLNLKKDLKEILCLERTPRDLNIFFNFFKAYKMQKETNDVVFISTKKLQKAFGLKSNDYLIYFDKFIKEWQTSEYKSFGNDKSCRTIKSFTDDFIDLCEKYINIEIPKDFYKKYYYALTDFSVNEIDYLKKIRREREQSISRTLTSIDEEFYHSTENSPFRKYHKLQALTKSIKSKIFNGFYDIDLQQCFASIAWNILDMKNCELEFAWLLNPQFKNDLREKIKIDFNLNSIEEAKQKVCALFTEKLTTGENKIVWYKNLHQEIKNRVSVYLGTKVEWNNKIEVIDTFHKFFTYHEQMIIKKLSQNLEVVLNMHDGIISKTKPSSNTVEYLGFEFLLSINEFVEIKIIDNEYTQNDVKTINNMEINNNLFEINKLYKENEYEYKNYISILIQETVSINLE